MASLTQDEAATRAELIEVDRYDVHLDLTGLLDGSTLVSRSRISFTCRAAGSTFVDVVADRLVSAELDGAPLDIATFDGERLPLPALAHGSHVLEVASTTDRTGQRTGVHRAVDPGDGEVYVWATFEPDDARRAFACFDQPDLKAVFGFTVEVPGGWTAVSNSAGTSVGATDGGPTTWTFDDTPRLSTYVTTVCAGPFHQVRREVDGYDLGLLVRRSLAHYLDEQADELFEVTAQGLAWFGQRFSMPFPQKTYTQVFAPEFQGAMENYGCVCWTDSVIFRSPPSASAQARRAVVLLHEMAHMWFGDIVTMRWWDDLWLNESFAEWSSHWAAAEATRFDQTWAHFVPFKDTGYVADRSPTTHPIRQVVPDVAAAMATFDGVTYAKGASVLRQLAALIGQDAVTAGLADHFAAHAWGNATLDDLLGAFSRASGTDLSQWSAQWLLAAGTNAFDVESDTQDGVYRSLTLVQSAPAHLPTLRRHRLDVGLYDLKAGALLLRDRVAVEADGPRTPVAVDGQRVADLVLPNDGDLDFVRVRLDPTSLATALAHGATLPDPLGRSLLRLVLWQHVDDGLVPAADVVRYAVQALRTEDEPAVRDALLSTMVDGTLWWTGTGRDALGQEVSRDLLDQLEGGPSLDGAGRKGLLDSAIRLGGPGELDRAEPLLEGDVDLRWGLLTRRSALGAHDPGALEALLREDPDPDGGARAVAVRAARPDAAAKAEVWEQAVVLREVPQTASRQVGLGFWQPGQDDLVAPYAQDFLDRLPGLAADGMLTTMTFVSSFFPRSGIGADFPDRAEAAAGAEGVPPIASSMVRERSDVLRRMLSARQG
jgi:aminopeptidase N